MMINRRLFLIGIPTLLVLVASYAFFIHLGGSNPIQIQQIASSPPSLSGITYEGTPQDEDLGISFEKIESIISLNPGKKLHTIYEVEPAGKLDNTM